VTLTKVSELDSPPASNSLVQFLGVRCPNRWNWRELSWSTEAQRSLFMDDRGDKTTEIETLIAMIFTKQVELDSRQMPWIFTRQIWRSSGLAPLFVFSGKASRPGRRAMNCARPKERGD
jgi:hypothetical protein